MYTLSEIRRGIGTALSFIFLSVITLSCANESIEFSSTPKKLANDEVINQEIEEVTYIPLKPNDRAYLAEVKKIVVLDSLIVVSCVNRSAIYLFRKDGSFVDLIRPDGSGPLEYQSLQDVIALNDETLLVADNGLGKILSYSLPLGRFTEEYSLDYAPFAMAFQDGYLFLLTNDFEKGTIKSVKYPDFKNVEIALEASPPFNKINSIQPFWQDEGELYLSASFSDVIYRADEGQFVPYVYVGKEEQSVRSASNEVLTDAFLGRDPEANKKISHILIPAGDFALVRNTFVVRLLNPPGHIFTFHTKDKESILFNQERVLSGIETLTGKPYPVFYTIDGAGMIYMSFFPSEEWYQKLEKLPADHPIRRAAESGLGEYFGDPAFENPVLVKFKPGKAFMEVERR
jgi:hypothetical protein